MRGGLPLRWYIAVLGIDEFWTYAGKKENKVWLIYAYCRETGEIVAYAWGSAI
jgi:IS1 family transposase